MGQLRRSALIGLAAVVTAVLPSAAAAAPPLNDGFAGRQVLPSVLPAVSGGSNVEATKELGEPPSSGFTQVAGRSVWFSWEATASGWVTVSTCGSAFDSMVDVYTGNALFNLERVAQWHEGPGFGCAPGGSEATFRAAAGTAYAIRVDGNLSPQPPEPVEGAIALQIAPTPSPANDGFAAAQAVSAESLEAGTFFRVDVPGFNWNATKEGGEPAHAGNQGGGSVWYSWTAPATGKASIKAVGASLEPVLGAYTGDSLAGLTSVAGQTWTPDTVEIAATAGTTYRIAVDGRLDSVSGLPSMGRFTFLIYLDAPRTEIDATPPATAIRRVVREKRKVTLRFGSSEAGGGFRCKRDGLRFATCASPKAYAGLRPGRHVFKVVAVDAAGNADPSAAVARVTIPKPKRQRLPR